MSQLIRFLFLMLLIISCDSNEAGYLYRENLDNFLSKELNYEIPDEETVLVILPLNSCNPCLKSTIEMLFESNASNLNIVISTDNKREIKEFGLDKVMPNWKVLIDDKNKYARYEIGVGAPLIFHFKDGECEFYSETTSVNLAKIKEHFGWS